MMMVMMNISFIFPPFGRDVIHYLITEHVDNL